MFNNNILSELFYDVNRGFQNKNDFIKQAKLLGISKEEAAEYYDNQATNQINKPVVQKYSKIVSPQYMFSVQMDLADVVKNHVLNGHIKYLLFIIDVFSRKLWIIPLKSKKSDKVLSVLKEWINEHKPKNITTDPGLEFANNKFKQFLKEKNIKLWLSRAGHKNQTAIVERVIRTIRNKIKKYLDAYNTKVWIDVLNDIVDNYNNTVHKSLGITPNEMANSGEKKINVFNTEDNEYEVGDKVRKLIKHNIFDKEGDKYSKTIYTVHKINGNRIFLNDSKGENDYYLPRELLKIEKAENPTPIERENRETKLAKARKIKSEKYRALTKEEKLNIGLAKNRSRRNNGNTVSAYSKR